MIPIKRPEYIWKFANNKDFLPDARRLSGKIAPSSNDVRNFSISYQNVIVCQSFFQTWFSLRKKWRTKWERSFIFLHRFFLQFSVCRGYCNVQVQNMVSKSGLHHEDWNVSQSKNLMFQTVEYEIDWRAIYYSATTTDYLSCTKPLVTQSKTQSAK